MIDNRREHAGDRLDRLVSEHADYQTTRRDSIATQEFGKDLGCLDVMGYIQQHAAIMLAAATQALKLRQCTLKRFAPHGTLTMTGLHRRDRKGPRLNSSQHSAT